MLTNIERRAIANLSIPRNALDLAHVLSADVHSGFSTAGVDPRELLKALEHDGLVVSLGDGHDHPGKLAAALDKHKTGRSMPDEKARIYEARLQIPHRTWRFRGEQWVMTDAGFDALHAPLEADEKPALATSLVEQIIRSELARVHQGEVTEDTQLAGKLLEDEWAEWARQVADAHEAATGERPMLPVAGGAGYSDATELLILDPENAKGSSYTEASPWYMAAVTVAVTDADTGSTITEATYTGYARKSVAAADMNSASAGAATNANAITYAACTGGSSTVIGFAKCVASTVGRLIKYGTCSTVNVTSTQQPLNFAVGAYSTTLD